MFFDKEFISFKILDVLSIEQQNVNFFNNGRNFCAISFRFRADAKLITSSKEYRLGDNTVSFFPARLDYTRIASIDKMIVIHFDTTDYISQNIECFTPKNAQAYRNLFMKIYSVWCAKEIGYKYKCSALLYEIFTKCFEENYKESTSASKIEPSITFLNENFKNPDITIKNAAEKSFMSEVYFRKLFNKKYGISPQKYLINLRLQHAIGLMSTGYYLLKEIALMSGYTDYKYFSSEFKRIKGISPSKYMYNYH